jgi:hypothetical protein
LHLIQFVITFKKDYDGLKLVFYSYHSTESQFN